VDDAVAHSVAVAEQEVVAHGPGAGAQVQAPYRLHVAARLAGVVDDDCLPSGPVQRHVGLEDGIEGGRVR
jgi:hypothetical protein